MVGADGDGAGGGEFDRVVDEVFECEGEKAFVAAEGFGIFAEVDEETDMFFGGVGGVHAEGHFADLIDVDAIGTDDGAGIFGAGEVEEVLDHHLEAEGVVVDDFNAAAGGFGVFIAGFPDGFDGGADGGEGCAEFVAGVGDEVGFHLEGTGDFGDVAHEKEGAAVVGAVVDGGGGGLAVEGSTGDLEGDLGSDGFDGGEGVAVEGEEVGMVDDGVDLFSEKMFDGAFKDSGGGGVGEADDVHVVGGDGDFVGVVEDGKEGDEVVFILLGLGGAGFEFFREGVGGAGEFSAGAGEVGIGAAGIVALGEVGEEVENAGDSGDTGAVGIEERGEGNEKEEDEDDE